MTGNGTERVIGQLQADVKNLHETLADLTDKVNTLNNHMQRQKGGYVAVAALGAMAGGAVSMIVKFWPS